MEQKLLVHVEVWSEEDERGQRHLLKQWVMDHNQAEQRRVLGEQCRSAFEAGQKIVTFARK